VKHHGDEKDNGGIGPWGTAPGEGERAGSEADQGPGDGEGKREGQKDCEQNPERHGPEVPVDKGAGEVGFEPGETKFGEELGAGFDGFAAEEPDELARLIDADQGDGGGLLDADNGADGFAVGAILGGAFGVGTDGVEVANEAAVEDKKQLAGSLRFVLRAGAGVEQKIGSGFVEVAVMSGAEEAKDGGFGCGAAEAVEGGLGGREAGGEQEGGQEAANHPFTIARV